MFGLKKRKPTLREQLAEAETRARRAEAELAGMKAQHQAMVVEKAFWMDQLVGYGNQIDFWQRKHRELLGQIAKETASLDLRAYAAEIERAIIAARPEPSALIATLAMAGKDATGVYTAAPRPEPLVDARGIPEPGVKIGRIK